MAKIFALRHFSAVKAQFRKEPKSNRGLGQILIEIDVITIPSSSKRVKN